MPTKEDIKTCRYYRLHKLFIGGPQHKCIMGFKRHNKPCSDSCKKSKQETRRVLAADIEHYPRIRTPN